MAIRWNEGLTSSFFYRYVDMKSWRDSGSEIELSSGSIKLSDSGLRSSATLDIDPRNIVRDKETMIRLYIKAAQSDGSMSKVALFTGFYQVPTTKYTGDRISGNVECYSPLKYANDVYLPLGWYAMAGSNGANLAKRLLEEVIPFPIKVVGLSPNLEKTLVAESGETYLSMVDYILKTINWRMKVLGDGTIVLCPKATECSKVFDYAKYDIIEQQLDIEKNWFDCPNVFRAVNGDSSTVVKDDDPSSMFSTISRGREIWAEDLTATPSDNESLQQYAKRRLKEEQKTYIKLSYTRRFVPDLYPTDIVLIRYPNQGLNSMFEIKSQTISIGYGATVSEEAEGNINE